MTVLADEFRNALGRFASGVTVVTTTTGHGAPLGVTVSAFTSLSLKPPLILVCLDNATSALETFLSAETFGVNILSDAQEAVSNAFAFPSDIPPFERFGYRIADERVPLLDDTVASLSCRRENVYAGGDHQIFVGTVRAATWDEEKSPLLYLKGRYRKLKNEQPA